MLISKTETVKWKIIDRNTGKLCNASTTFNKAKIQVLVTTHKLLGIPVYSFESIIKEN